MPNLCWIACVRVFHQVLDADQYLHNQNSGVKTRYFEVPMHSQHAHAPIKTQAAVMTPAHLLDRDGRLPACLVIDNGQAHLPAGVYVLQDMPMKAYQC
jgi:hypothetical protein